MKILMVTSHDVPTPEDVPQIITAMDPPALPFFSGQVRVVPDPESVDLVLAYLDDDAGIFRLNTNPHPSDLARIADQEVVINGKPTTYGAVDKHAHAALHDDEASGQERGMATVLLQLLDDLDDARERIAEMGS